MPCGKLYGRFLLTVNVGASKLKTAADVWYKPVPDKSTRRRWLPPPAPPPSAVAQLSEVPETQPVLEQSVVPIQTVGEKLVDAKFIPLTPNELRPEMGAFPGKRVDDATGASNVNQFPVEMPPAVHPTWSCCAEVLCFPCGSKDNEQLTDDADVQVVDAQFVDVALNAKPADGVGSEEAKFNPLMVT